jgi:hypothetical protein
MPFCKRHANLLPEPHKKRLWTERTKGRCGACEAMDIPKAWNFLYHLGIALLMLIEFGDDARSGHCGCGAPPRMRDDEGFCWVCGVDDSFRTFDVARKAMKKYKIQVRGAFDD